MSETELGPISWGWSIKKCSTSQKFFEPGGVNPRIIWSVKMITSPSLGSGGFSVPGTLQWMVSLLAKLPVATYPSSCSSVTREWTNCKQRTVWPLLMTSYKRRLKAGSRFRAGIGKPVSGRGKESIRAYVHVKLDNDGQVKLVVYVRANGAWRIIIF